MAAIHLRRDKRQELVDLPIVCNAGFSVAKIEAIQKPAHLATQVLPERPLEILEQISRS